MAAYNISGWGGMDPTMGGGGGGTLAPGTAPVDMWKQPITGSTNTGIGIAQGAGQSQATWLQQLLQGQGLGAQQPISAGQAGQQTGQNYQALFQQLMQSNPQLAQQMNQTAPTTSFGGASDALTQYWQQQAKATAAGLNPSGASFDMSLIGGMIPGAVAGQAMQYQNQQQNYMGNLLNLQGNMSKEAMGTAGSLETTSMNNTSTHNNDFMSLMNSALGQGSNMGAGMYETLLGQRPTYAPMSSGGGMNAGTPGSGYGSDGGDMSALYSPWDPNANWNWVNNNSAGGGDAGNGGGGWD